MEFKSEKAWWAPNLVISEPKHASLACARAGARTHACTRAREAHVCWPEITRFALPFGYSWKLWVPGWLISTGFQSFKTIVNNSLVISEPKHGALARARAGARTHACTRAREAHTCWPEITNELLTLSWNSGSLWGINPQEPKVNMNSQKFFDSHEDI